MEIRRIMVSLALGFLAGLFFTVSASGAPVVREEGKTYIVDRTGERWDVTQAESLGFDPEGFQYGIGRNAFTPLDDSRVRKEARETPGHLRVIGVSVEKEKRAYSVPRLTWHEIANSTLGGKEIAVAY